MSTYQSTYKIVNGDATVDVEIILWDDSAKGDDFELFPETSVPVGAVGPTTKDAEAKRTYVVVTVDGTTCEFASTGSVHIVRVDVDFDDEQIDVDLTGAGPAPAGSMVCSR